MQYLRFSCNIWRSILDNFIRKPFFHTSDIGSYIPSDGQIANFLLPHEDNEDKEAEHDVGDVDYDPVPVGAAHDEADQLHGPVHAHHHKQFQVKGISEIKNVRLH